MQSNQLRQPSMIGAPVSRDVVGTVAGGAPLLRRGKGENVLGDPRAALAWLGNELSGLHIALEAGQVVTTGTCLVPLPIAAGDELAADFGLIGGASLRLL